MEEILNFYANVIRRLSSSIILQFHELQFASLRKLTTFHFCNMIYLQYGGIYYCRQSNATFTPYITTVH